MDEQLVDLINRAIDGEASHMDAARLRSTLASDPGAMETHDAIRRTVLEIESIPQLEPPKGLRDEIRESIRARQQSTPVENPAARRTPFRRTPVIRYAWAIAAGIVLGFALHPLILSRHAPLDSRNVSGAMAPITDSNGTASRLSKTIASPDVRATVTAVVTRKSVAVGIRLEPGTTRPLGLDWNPDRFTLDRVRRVAGNPNVSLHPGHVTISVESPTIVELRLSRIGPDAPPVDLRSETPAGSTSGALVEITDGP